VLTLVCTTVPLAVETRHVVKPSALGSGWISSSRTSAAVIHANLFQVAFEWLIGALLRLDVPLVLARRAEIRQYAAALFARTDR